MKLAILINGPPRAGKDTAGNHILACIPEAVKVKFSDPVKDGAHHAYGLDCSIDHYEDVKDIPNDDFLGLTPREAYIQISEDFMKPRHGKHVYGNLAAGRIMRNPASLFVIPDSGFQSETESLLKVLGNKNVLLIRVHREGCNFSSDSRSYIKPDCLTLDVKNIEGRIEDFQLWTTTTVVSWINRRRNR